MDTSIAKKHIKDSEMSKQKTVRIAWETVFGQKCEKPVLVQEAEAEADRIRGLPDVRTETVQIVEN